MTCDDFTYLLTITAITERLYQLGDGLYSRFFANSLVVLIGRFNEKKNEIFRFALLMAICYSKKGFLDLPFIFSGRKGSRNIKVILNNRDAKVLRGFNI